MMPMWFIGLLAALTTLIGAIGVGYKHGHDVGAQEIQSQWDDERAQAAIKSQELQSTVDKLRETKNRELAKLNRDVRNLTDSLRSRPERPSSAATASAGDDRDGCTGATVYKQDGEFLIGEATRADQLRIALIQCQAAYQSASQ